MHVWVVQYKQQINVKRGRDLAQRQMSKRRCSAELLLVHHLGDLDGVHLEHVLVVPQHDGVLLGQGVAHLLEIKVGGLK